MYRRHGALHKCDAPFSQAAPPCCAAPAPRAERRESRPPRDPWDARTGRAFHRDQVFDRRHVHTQAIEIDVLCCPHQPFEAARTGRMPQAIDRLRHQRQFVTAGGQERLEGVGARSCPAALDTGDDSLRDPAARRQVALTERGKHHQYDDVQTMSAQAAACEILRARRATQAAVPLWDSLDRFTQSVAIRASIRQE